MVNFGPLTPEICWQVWGTLANFKGFRLLAALLHDILVGRQPNFAALNSAPLIFGRAAITLGIGPHSSLQLFLIKNNIYFSKSASASG